MPNPSLTGGVFVLEGGAAQPTGGAKTKCSTSDTEFDAGYFREGEDCLFKAAFGGRYFSRSARYSSSVIGDGRLWPVRS